MVDTVAGTDIVAATPFAAVAVTPFAAVASLPFAADTVLVASAAFASHY